MEPLGQSWELRIGPGEVRHTAVVQVDSPVDTVLVGVRRNLAGRGEHRIGSAEEHHTALAEALHSRLVGHRVVVEVVGTAVEGGTARAEGPHIAAALEEPHTDSEEAVVEGSPVVGGTAGFVEEAAHSLVAEAGTASLWAEDIGWEAVHSLGLADIRRLAVDSGSTTFLGGLCVMP